MDSFLKSKKVIVCAGSGGVGKTTMSAALGVRAAEIGLKVLVLTVDPAKRLATALGIEDTDDRDVLVPNQKFSGELYAARVNPKASFDNFVREAAPNQAAIDQLFRNPLYDRLSTTLGGSQEFTSLERLYQARRSQKYDLIILDTPPAAHAIEFLDASVKMEELFQESVLKWFIVPSEKQSKFSQFLNKGSQLAMKALEALAGGAFIRDLIDFFQGIYAVREPLVQRLIDIRKLLQSDDCSFVLVTGFDVDKIQEARNFKSDLEERSVRLGYVIINRAFPRWYSLNNSDEDLAAVTKEDVSPLLDYFRRLERFYGVHQKAFDAFQQEIGKKVRFIRVVDFDSEVYDLGSLGGVAKELVEAASKGGS